MKILHICQRDDPDAGGSLRVAEALVREQCATGLDAWLLFLYGEPGGICKSMESGTICLGLHSSRDAMLGMVALRKAVCRIAPDLIHSHDGIIWPRLCLLMIGIPIVMHSHLPLSASGQLKVKIGNFLIKSTTKALVGISLHTIETWINEKYPPSKIHYVPNGADFNRFTPLTLDRKSEIRKRLDLPLDKHILLWVGRIHRLMKGADRVERIADLLPDNMVLVVVGNGPDFEGMQKKCAHQISEGCMIMVGSTGRPEDYYRAADEFLFTSYHEPFGLVILEAVAAGLPLLAFPVTQGGGAVKLLEEFNATILVDEDSNDSVRMTLSEVSVRSNHTVDNRNKALTRYSWTAVSRKVNEVYKLVLNGNI